MAVSTEKELQTQGQSLKFAPIRGGFFCAFTRHAAKLYSGPQSQDKKYLFLS
jgi:hypothetical protein